MTTNRHQALGLSDEEAVEMYRTMLLARKIDERMWLLNRSGKIPFVVSCQGQEAAQVGAAYALNRDTDYVLPYYRDIGVVLAFGMTAKDLMMSGFAKAADPNSGGRQMPGHFGQKENRIVTGSSPVTTQVPHAVGIALAGRMDKKDIVSFVTFGEGSSNQGIFTKGQTLPPCINCRSFSCVKTISMLFLSRMTDRWRARKYPTGRQATACRESLLTETTCWKFTGS